MPNFPKALPALLTVAVLSLASATAVADTKATQARAKAQSAANRAPAVEKKGKKGVPAAKPGAAKTAAAKPAKGKDKNADKRLASARTQRQPAKGEPQLANKKGQDRNKTANARSKAEGNQLASRLTSAKLVPASFVLNERRGKFGKPTTPAARNHETVASGNPPRKGAPPPKRQPTREARRELERKDESFDDKDQAPHARRPREVNRRNDDDNDPPSYNIAQPDKIEVTESGQNSPTLTRLLALSDSRPLTPFGAVVTKNNSQPSRRNDLVMPPQRVLEIQYELAKRGFYNAEPNGVYDDTTVLAMWEFQKNYGLPATGYPTAHSLKRLGLTGW